MPKKLTTKQMTWEAQPGPQKLFVHSSSFEVIYGGARGGGKTDAVLGDFGRHVSLFGRGAKGLLVRRTRVALEPTISRARVIYESFASWKEQKSRFEWPCGAVLYFRYLDSDRDADAYQGHDYSRVYVEELTQFSQPTGIDKLKATLRSSAGAHCGFRATCNPGGPGHNWVKDRYISPGAYNPTEARGLEQIFIPAKLSDNPKLIEQDPMYVARLRQSGSAELVRAWLEGDWNIVEGAFFDKWSLRNIVTPFAIPAWWTRFRSFDWGYAAPFSVGWWAVVSDDYRTESGIIPRGAMVRYREWYGSNGTPNEGLRLTAEEIAAGIRDREKGEKITYGVADPSIFREDGGPSHGERMRRAGVAFMPADNTRIGRQGALSGWDQMRARISGNGIPMLYVFDTCRNFIRTVPVLQHDPDRLEDLDSDAEDHVADETRYACLSRPMMAIPPQPSSNPSDLWRWGRSREVSNDWKVV